MSIRAFAAHLGMAAASVSNWERRGELVRLRSETQQLLDTDLTTAGEDVQARFDATLAPHQPIGPLPPPRNGVRDFTYLQPVAAAIDAFRTADAHIGGAPLYATVVAYLRTDIGPRLVEHTDGPDATAVFAAAAALLEMAGWMAHDRGDDTAAQAHFRKALPLTAVCDDPQLRAQVLASMSHLAAHLDQPREAVDLAQRGMRTLRSASASPRLAARLSALQARGLADLDEAAECTTLLDRAHQHITAAADQPTSPWISHFDEASLAMDAGRCMRRLGELAEARRHAETVIAQRPVHRARSRALGQLLLADVLVAQDEPERACAVAADVVESPLAPRCAPLARGLSALQTALSPHGGSTAVAALCQRLRAAAHDTPCLPGVQQESGTPGGRQR